jgi:hypothetical protein
VKFWNARGKKFGIVPQFKVGEFAAVWRTWWESLQPNWRPQECWPPSRDTPPDEDWSVLRRGGINGLFVVLMCLSWWAQKLRSAKEQLAFKEAMSDVAWVIQQVFNSFAPFSQLKRPAEGNDDTDRTKRQRVD